MFQTQESLEDLSDDEDYVPYVPLKERRRLELEKREKYLKRKTEPQPHVEAVHNVNETASEEVSDECDQIVGVLIWYNSGIGIKITLNINIQLGRYSRRFQAFFFLEQKA